MQNILTDDQYAVVEKLLPRNTNAKKAGRPSSISDQVALEWMLYALSTGCQWRKLPESYGNWHTVYTRYTRWVSSWVFWRILLVLQKIRKMDIRSSFLIPLLCGHIHVLLEHRKKGGTSALKIQRMTYHQNPRLHGRYQGNPLIHTHFRKYFWYSYRKYDDWLSSPRRVMSGETPCWQGVWLQRNSQIALGTQHRSGNPVEEKQNRTDQARSANIQVEKWDRAILEIPQELSKSLLQIRKTRRKLRRVCSALIDCYLVTRDVSIC